MKLLQKKINFSPSSIENHFEVEQISFAFLISISFAAIFFQLGNRSFENRGYIIYAEVAREMIRSGDWIVPRLKGEIYLHKPILLIWFIAIPSALFGKVTPFFARLPSAISALFGIALTFYLGKRMFNDYRSGLISSFILLSSKEYFWQAKTSRTDMLLTFFILASLLCFYTAFESSGRKRFYFSILFYINIAFATLTKGPPGILFPMGTVIVFLIANKRIKMLFEPGFISGFFIFWAIILSYIFIYFNCVNPSAFLIKFKAAKILTRPEPFYYYLIQFWPRFFPWSLFLPSAVLFFYKGNPAFRNQRLFLLMWVLIIFVIIFSIDNKSYRYLLPLFPAYSLILGGAWQEAYLLKSLKKEGLIKWWEVSYKISLLIFIISIVAYPAFIWWVSHSIFLTLIFEFICIFGCILLGYAYFKGNPLIKVLAISLFALIIYGTYFFYISKEDKKHSPCMKMVSIIKPLVKVDSLKTFDFDKSLHLDFYLDTVVPKLETPSETVKFLTDKNSNSCLTSEKGYNLITSLLLKREFKIYSIQCRKKTYFLVMRKEKYDSSIQILFLN